MITPAEQRIISYFKRYKMEIDLRDVPAAVLPEGYAWVETGAGQGFVQHFGWLPEYAAAFGQTAAFLKGA